VKAIRISSRSLIRLPTIALLVLGLVGCGGGGGDECPIYEYVLTACLIPTPGSGQPTGPSQPPGPGQPPGPLLPPSIPVGVSIDEATNGAHVSWNPVLGATSYNIYYASSPGVTKTNYSTLPNGNKVTVLPGPKP
jgi:hypothetical protein